MSRSIACYQGRQIHATHGPRTGAILGVVYSRELFWPPGCTISWIPPSATAKRSTFSAERWVRRSRSSPEA